MLVVAGGVWCCTVTDPLWGVCPGAHRGLHLQLRMCEGEDLPQAASGGDQALLGGAGSPLALSLARSWALSQGPPGLSCEEKRGRWVCSWHPLGYRSGKCGDSQGCRLGGSLGSPAAPGRAGISRSPSAGGGSNASAAVLCTNGLECVSPVPVGCHEEEPCQRHVASVLMALSLLQGLFALSSLLRHFPYAQQQFLKLGGLQVLRSLFRQKGMETLHVRVVTLLYDLIMEKVRSRQGGSGTWEWDPPPSPTRCARGARASPQDEGEEGPIQPWRWSGAAGAPQPWATLQRTRAQSSLQPGFVITLHGRARPRVLT